MTGPGPSDPAQQGPPPATPPPTPPAGEQWGQQGSTPDWAAKAQQWRPAEVAAGPAAGIAYADLTTRLVAFIIDGIILAVGYGIVVGLLLTSMFLSFGGFFVYFVLSALLYGAASAIYFIYTWTTMKASPGQRVLGLMTVNEADGAAISQNQAIMRWAYLFGPSVVAQVLSFSSFGTVGLGAGLLGSLVSLAVLGYVIYLVYTTANDPKRQGFHDKQAKTVVVKIASGA